MTTKRPSDFVIRERIAAVTDPRLLRHLLTRAQGHVAEAKFIGWPALAQSLADRRGCDQGPDGCARGLPRHRPGSA